MYKLISTGLGIGYIRKGGGTVASAFCCLLMYLFQAGGDPFNAFLSVGVAILLLSFGTLASWKVEPLWGKDNYRVVIDEIAGMWISMLFIPVTISCLLTAFILFRIFDIWKPMYIRQAEKLSGGIGVMMDDVLAGAYSNILMHILLAYKLL